MTGPPHIDDDFANDTCPCVDCVADRAFFEQLAYDFEQEEREAAFHRRRRAWRRAEKLLRLAEGELAKMHVDDSWVSEDGLDRARSDLGRMLHNRDGEGIVYLKEET